MQTIFFFPFQLTEEETDFQELCFFKAHFSNILGMMQPFIKKTKKKPKNQKKKNKKILKAACIHKVLTETNFCISSYALGTSGYISSVEIFLVLTVRITTESDAY